MRIGQSIWHSQRISENNAEIPTYDTPSEIKTQCNYFTVMQASSRGYMEILKYGEKLENTWVAIANSVFFEGQFKVGDVMWLDGESPVAEVEQEYGNGASATAIIKSISPVNKTIHITLERNQNQILQ